MQPPSVMWLKQQFQKKVKIWRWHDGMTWNFAHQGTLTMTIKTYQISKGYRRSQSHASDTSLGKLCAWWLCLSSDHGTKCCRSITPAHSLIAAKKRGGRDTPSASGSVIRVCEASERCDKRSLAVTDMVECHVTQASSQPFHMISCPRLDDPYSIHCGNTFVSEPDGSHIFTLIRSISERCCKVWFITRWEQWINNKVRSAPGRSTATWSRPLISKE